MSIAIPAKKSPFRSCLCCTCIFLNFQFSDAISRLQGRTASRYRYTSTAKSLKSSANVEQPLGKIKNRKHEFLIATPSAMNYPLNLVPTHSSIKFTLLSGGQWATSKSNRTVSFWSKIRKCLIIHSKMKIIVTSSIFCPFPLIWEGARRFRA